MLPSKAKSVIFPRMYLYIKYQNKIHFISKDYEVRSCRPQDMVSYIFTSSSHTLLTKIDVINRPNDKPIMGRTPNLSFNVRATMAIPPNMWAQLQHLYKPLHTHLISCFDLPRPWDWYTSGTWCHQFQGFVPKPPPWLWSGIRCSLLPICSINLWAWTGNTLRRGNCFKWMLYRFYRSLVGIGPSKDGMTKTIFSTDFDQADSMPPPGKKE